MYISLYVICIFIFCTYDIYLPQIFSISIYPYLLYLIRQLLSQLNLISKVSPKANKLFTNNLVMFFSKVKFFSKLPKQHLKIEFNKIRHSTRRDKTIKSYHFKASSSFLSIFQLLFGREML